MVRIAQGIRLRDLAESADVRQTDLRRWERGLDLPTPDEIGRLAGALSVDPVSLRKAQVAVTGEKTPGEGYTTRQALERGVRDRAKPPPKGRRRILDLFCGSGGFSYGFEATGGFTVTAGIDLLGDRISTFESNHRHAASITADICAFDVERLGELAEGPDIVIGGPPCQGFSSIRPFRTYTEGDPRNNLYEYFALTVASLQPRWFVLENVLGLLTNRKGRSFKELMETFSEIGYRADWRVVNAALFGLPQNRERLIIVGSREGQQFKWPTPTHQTDHQSMSGNGHLRLTAPGPLFGGYLSPAVTTMEAIHDLPEVEAGTTATEYRHDIGLTPYEQRMRHGSDQLTLHQATRHSEKMLEIIRHAGANRYALPEGLVTSGFSSSYSRLAPDQPSVTLTVNFVHPASNRCIHPFQDRALTPREGARLQSFPDTFRFLGTRSQIVKQIGNAVPPLLGEVLAKSLIEQW